MKKREIVEHVPNQSAGPVEVNHIGVRARGQRQRVVTLITGESMTKQADKDKACIHRILDRAKHTGMLPVRDVQPLTGELPDVESFHDAMNIVVKAREKFMELPVAVREKFGHSQEAFLEFVSDEKNGQAMIDMGLAVKQVAPEPVHVHVTNSVAPPSAPQNAGAGGTTQGA